jgi:Tat protein secretion system quality control protein TatD with DNase activity
MRVPLAKQAEVKEMLGSMQRQEVIEESDSPWSSPVVLVKKNNGELFLVSL